MSHHTPNPIAASSSYPQRGDRFTSVAEALEARRLDWSVATEPIYYDSRPVGSGAKEIEAYRAVVRTDVPKDDPTRVLSVQGKGYSAIDNRLALSPADGVLKAYPDARIVVD